MISKQYHVYDIKTLLDYYKSGSLFVDNSYQRRKVWIERDKIKLIETILLGYVIPALYFWDAEIDQDTGRTIKHIVDGQQRINAIVDFIDDQFKLSKTHFKDDQELTNRCGNKLFSELTSEDKIKIWTYQLPIVQLSGVTNQDEIRKIFLRLNLTEYNLSAQEKRHSSSNGEFASLASELSEMEFWDNYNLFNKSELKRMGDIEFCASLLLLARRGIVNQTDQTLLNQAYDDYSESYAEKDSDKARVLQWLNIIEKFISDNSIRFIQKKTQLYTMFCIAEYIERTNNDVNNDMISNFDKFVKTYLIFKNSEENSGKYVEKIIQYKLAASEGVNKQSNRMIRFEILRDIIFEEGKELSV